MAPKVSAEPLGFCVRALQQVFYYAKGSPEPACRNPKGSAEFWGTFGSPGPSFEDWLFFLPLSAFLGGVGGVLSTSGSVAQVAHR